MKCPSKMLQNLEYVNIDQEIRGEIQHRMENEKKPYYGITYFNYEENFEAFDQVQTTSYF